MSSFMVARCGPRGRDLLVDQRLDVLVVDVLLSVGERLEAHERIFELIAGELIAQFLELVHEGMAAGMLAHDQRGLLHADVLRHHDLVGLRMLEHAVLVDAALVREGVAPDDRLVVLHRERGDGGNELRRPRQHLGVDGGPIRHHVVAHPHRHHRLFQRSVAGALADAVDGAFNLPRAGAHAGERVRHRHAEIVMAVHGKASLVGIRHPLAQHLDEREIFLRHRVADGVGDIDGGGAGLDRRLDAAAEEVVLAAGAVLARPLDIVGVPPRPRHRGDHRLVDLFRLHLQLPLHVHRRGGDEGMDARALRRLDGFAGAVDVVEAGAGEAADHRFLGALGDLVDGGEVAFRGDRKAGLDDVDAHLVEELGDFELLLVGHRRARALLAVAQGGVEDNDAVFLGPDRRGCGRLGFG
jgi:hypothetical protein